MSRLAASQFVSASQAGFAFESTVQSALRSALGFAVEARPQAQGDEGIDLVGTWGRAHECKLAVQCKRYSASASVSVNIIREFESSVARWDLQTKATALGVIASNVRLSASATKWLNTTAMPMGHALVRDNGQLASFALNRACARAFPGVSCIKKLHGDGGVLVMGEVIVEF